MNKPIPRQSKLAGTNPLTAYSASARLETPPSRSKDTRDISKITLRMSRTTIEKARTAWQIDGIPRGIRNFSAWIEEILDQTITNIETTHGQLPGTPAGIIPNGWDTHQTAPPRP